jgi:cysteine synthase B
MAVTTRGKALPGVPVDARAYETWDARDIPDLVGNTPLVPLSFPDVELGVEVLAKAEWLNPGGSVKDRAARAIVFDGERRGSLAGRRLLDASSGNTAIAYAMLGAARGFPVTICLPASASVERKTLLQAYGAEVIETDALEGSDGAILAARRLANERPDLYFYADQYNNPANSRAHFETTGPEIWRWTHGTVTHIVCGLGTSGTLMGVGRYLKAQNPGIELIAVQPDDAFHGIEGLKHLPTSIVPGIFDASLPDRTYGVRTEDAYAMTRHLALGFGLLVGPSSGAAAFAAQQLATELSRGCVVAIFPDGGERYLSLELW